VPAGVDSVPIVEPLELPKFLSRAAVVCADYRHDLEGYWSDRFWLALGLAACVVRRFSPGLAPLVPPYIYHDRDQLVRIVSDVVSDPLSRRRMGALGRHQTMRNATYESRLEELLTTTLSPVAANESQAK